MKCSKVDRHGSWEDQLQSQHESNNGELFLRWLVAITAVLESEFTRVNPPCSKQGNNVCRGWTDLGGSGVNSMEGGIQLSEVDQEVTITPALGKGLLSITLVSE